MEHTHTHAHTHTMNTMPMRPKHPALVIIDSATYLFTISSPDIRAHSGSGDTQASAWSRVCQDIMSIDLIIPKYVVMVNRCMH